MVKRVNCGLKMEINKEIGDVKQLIGKLVPNQRVFLVNNIPLLPATSCDKKSMVPGYKDDYFKLYILLYLCFRVFFKALTEVILGLLY